MKQLSKIDFVIYFLTDCVGIAMGFAIMLFGYMRSTLNAISIVIVLLGIVFMLLCGVLLIRLPRRSKESKKNNPPAKKPYPWIGRYSNRPSVQNIQRKR